MSRCVQTVYAPDTQSLPPGRQRSLGLVPRRLSRAPPQGHFWRKALVPVGREGARKKKGSRCFMPLQRQKLSRQSVRVFVTLLRVTLASASSQRRNARSVVRTCHRRSTLVRSRASVRFRERTCGFQCLPLWSFPVVLNEPSCKCVGTRFPRRKNQYCVIVRWECSVYVFPSLPHLSMSTLLSDPSRS